MFYQTIFKDFFHITLFIFTVIPCTGMQCIKTQVLGNRCTIKPAFSHIFIRIQVGYSEQYIDILKFYLNLYKYMAEKRVLWCIYLQVQGCRNVIVKNGKTEGESIFVFFKKNP